MHSKTISQAWQQGSAVLKCAQISNATMEALWLLRFALGAQDVYAQMQKNIDRQTEDFYQSLLKKRAKDKVPLAYLLQTQEFFGALFKVTPDVLIPRFETEVLVRQVLALLNQQKAGEVSILDVGTGSGILALSLARHWSFARICAIDICDKALQVAKENARLQNLDSRIEFIHSDVRCCQLGKKFDIIVSNPPYIASAEIETLAADVQQEPRLALDGGERGFDVIDALLKKSSELLKKNGWIFLEVGYNQAVETLESLHALNFVNAQSFSDENHILRVVCAQKNHG